MKKYIILFATLIVGCSDKAPPPEFESFRLVEEGRFEICFRQPFSNHQVMLALEILNNDGTVIDRKWHDEYQILYDGRIQGGSKCYDSAFINFMSAANSTPKEIRDTLHSHKDTMIKEIRFHVATSKDGNYRSKKPDTVYISGVYNPTTSNSRLTNKDTGRHKVTSVL
ncbi:hypothetical protein [Microbulbifer sp. ANSA005]|uniref:hypothetical protein n=1 Tax=Microbulbifer sp. ANSA005 TaxID=3243362 RepID=UPI004041EA58